MKALGLLSSLVAWAIFTCGPLFVLEPTLSADDIWILLLLLFTSAAETGFLWLLVRRAIDSVGAVKRGAAMGFLVPTVGGFFLATAMGSFEARGVGLILGIPSAIGGALAGWIQWRAKARNRSRAGRSSRTVAGILRQQLQSSLQVEGGGEGDAGLAGFGAFDAADAEKFLAAFF